MKIDLQKLLDILAEGGDFGAALSDEVTSADLAAIESEAIEAGRAIANSADRSPADADRIDQIVKVAQKVREVTASRSAAAAELDKNLAAKMALLEPAKPAEEKVETPVVEEKAPEAPAEEVVETPAAELEPVAASAKPVRVNVSEIKSRIPAPKPVLDNPASYLFAAADVPGVPAGAGMDFLALAASMERRLLGLGSDTGPMVKSAQPVYGQVASLHRPDGEYVVNGNAGDQAILDAVADEKRLSGKSLTAAGGWCAPSEIFYDLCDPGMSMDGLWNGPGVRSRRGGVQWTLGPNFCDVFSAMSSGGFFTQTETEVNAATTKPCFEIPCPTFNECRLDAMGFCLTGGLLTRSGYPEIIADWVRKSVIAFAHYRNADIINRIRTGSTNTGVVGACGAGIGGGAVGSVLSAVENQVQAFRERHRLPQNASLELLAPFWIKSVIRADVAQRQGLLEVNVSDQQINSWFATRGVSVQYLYDWQPMNGATCSENATDWPGFAEFILYRAGTWVEVTQPIISIDARFDASLTQTNRYGVRFTEDGLCIIQRCLESRRFSIDLCPTGATTAPEAACVCAST